MAPVKSFSSSEQLDIANEANRAPSVHNVQPARWRFNASGDITLFMDTQRQLPVADPSGTDNRISLGTAIEGMDLALKKRALRIGAIQPLNESPEEQLQAVARIELDAHGEKDALGDFIFQRNTYRGKFRQLPTPDVNRLVALLEDIDDVITIHQNDSISDVAHIYDQCGYEFLSKQAYQQELHKWMRFSRRHPRWDRDGLNAEALALSALERIGASILFSPAVFSILVTLGLARPVIAEGAKVKSASAIVIFIAKEQQDALETGRRFYRLWLTLCREGYALCPMSALSDSPSGMTWLKQNWTIPREHRIVNVFRVGVAPTLNGYQSARLPASEIIV